MQYTITNPEGAQIRIGPSTSAGIIRKAPLGTVVNVVAVVKGTNSREDWLLLTPNDPTSGTPGRPWRYSGAEVTAYVALYVGGTTYAEKVPGSDTLPEEPGTYPQGYDEGWNACLDALKITIPGRR